MQIFKATELILDKTKPNILFIEKTNIDKYTHVYGTSRVLRNYLKDKFNIITLGTSSCNLKTNFFKFSRSYSDHLLRKVDNPKDYLKINDDKIQEAFKRDFETMPIIDYIILGTDDFFRLPLTQYCSKPFDQELHKMQNEFFDYIGEDKETLDKIKIMNKNLIDNWGL